MIKNFKRSKMDKEFKRGDILFADGGKTNSWVFIFDSIEDDKIKHYDCICTQNYGNGSYFKSFYSGYISNVNAFSDIRYANDEEKELLFFQMHKIGLDFDFNKLENVTFQTPFVGDIIVRNDDENDYCVIVRIKDGKYYVVKPKANCFLTDGMPGLFLNETLIRDYHIDDSYFDKKDKKSNDYSPNEAFQRVLVRDYDWETWKISLYSHITDNDVPFYLRKPYMCVDGKHKYCIIYNDETKHLLGTNENL